MNNKNQLKKFLFNNDDYSHMHVLNNKITYN